METQQPRLKEDGTQKTLKNHQKKESFNNPHLQHFISVHRCYQY